MGGVSQLGLGRVTSSFAAKGELFLVVLSKPMKNTNPFSCSRFRTTWVKCEVMLGGGKMKVLDDVSVSDNDIVDFVQRMCTPKMAVLAV